MIPFGGGGQWSWAVRWPGVAGVPVVPEAGGEREQALGDACHQAGHRDRAVSLEELPGARLFAIEFEDMQDASLAALSALSADPERVLEAAKTGATSYFERMRRDHAEELQAGLARLCEDVAAGRAPRRAGTATVLSWRAPCPQASRTTAPCANRPRLPREI